MAAKKIKATNISWDWKSAPTIDELKKALKPFGVGVYEDPALEGSDTYGYIFTKEVLSDKQLREISNDLNDLDDDDNF